MQLHPLLGSGVAIAARKKIVGAENMDKPRSTSPLALESANELEEKIRLFLAQTKRPRVTPPDFNTLKEIQPNPYRGTYYLHYINKEREVRTGLLLINASNYVIYIDADKKYAYGQADLLENVLNITLKDAEKQRNAFCCIKVGPQSPQIDSTIYSGSFSGVSLSDAPKPFAFLFIVEFIQATFSSTEGEIKKLLEKVNQPYTMTKESKKEIDLQRYLISKSAYLTFDDEIHSWNDIQK